VYIGTPHQGSDDADLTQTLLTVYSVFAPLEATIVSDMLPTVDFLELQQQQYRAIASNYATCCCYETRNTSLPGGYRSLVVPESSAVISGIPEAEVAAVPLDHIDIAKCRGIEDDGFSVFTPFLRVVTSDAVGRSQKRWSKYKG
jgi:hypothetical protein